MIYERSYASKCSERSWPERRVKPDALRIYHIVLLNFLASIIIGLGRTTVARGVHRVGTPLF